MTNYFHKTKRYPGTKFVLSPVTYTQLFFSLLIMVFIATSCEQKATDIGFDLLPSGDFTSVRGTDTISVEAYSVYSDSVSTTNKTYSYLGGLYDPYLGNVTADFVAQLRLTEKWAGKGAFVIDSVKLDFTINGTKGILSTLQALQIYEIDEDLSSDSIYYSNRDPRAIKLLATVELPLIVKDTVTSISLDLPVSFGEYLTRDTTFLYQQDPETDFRSFFKGIYLTLGEVISKSYLSPQLMAMQFETGNFVITLYYHYTSDDSRDTYLFFINSNSVRYNRYNHDYSTALPEKKIINIGQEYRDTITGQQPFNGVRTRLKLPGLEYFKNLGSVSVNKARLSIPVFLDDDIYTDDDLPSRIYMSYKDSEGAKHILPDYIISPAFFDGSYNSTTGKYSFNITSFVQEYLEGKIPDTELEMYFPEGEYRNVILKANGAINTSTFEFVYTTF